MDVDVTLSTYFSYHTPGWEAALEYLDWEGPEGFSYPAAALGHPTEDSPWHERERWPEVLDRLEEGGAQIAALHSPIESAHDLTTADTEIRDRTRRDHEMALEFASKLHERGLGYRGKVWVVVHLLEPYRFPEEEVEARTERGVEEWQRLLGVAEEYPGARPVLENLGGDKLRQRVVERVWNETGYAGGICLDTGHLRMDPNGKAKLDEFAEHSRVMHLQRSKQGADSHHLATLDEDWTRKCLTAVRELGEEFELVIQEHRGDRAEKHETLREAARTWNLFHSGGENLEMRNK